MQNDTTKNNHIKIVRTTMLVPRTVPWLKQRLRDSKRVEDRLDRLVQYVHGRLLEMKSSIGR